MANLPGFDSVSEPILIVVRLGCFRRMSTFSVPLTALPEQGETEGRSPGRCSANRLTVQNGEDVRKEIFPEVKMQKTRLPSASGFLNCQ